jgi:hypothetical protein
VTGIARVRQDVEHAGTTAELLDAAYQAFELTMAAIRSCEDSGAAAIAALAFAAAAAGEGRDAIAAAPALPSARPVAADGVLPADAGEDVASVVAALAGLAGLLAGRLRRAAGTAAPGDRAACAAAARHADRIRVLLSGGEP